jgi:hypothetical protein
VNSPSPMGPPDRLASVGYTMMPALLVAVKSDGARKAAVQWSRLGARVLRHGGMTRS